MARLDSGRRFDAGVLFDAPSQPQKTMSQNLISQPMTDGQRDAMLADLTAFQTKWAPYLCPLTPQQIANLARLAPEDIGLLELALTYAQQNPGQLPGNINIAEFARDVNTAKQATNVNARTQQIADQTRCTLIALMSDGFSAARDIYRIAQALGRTPENTAFLDAFGTRFARSSQTPPTPPPAP